MKLIVFTLLAAAAASAAHAQTVYRCGSTYSQAPCAEAKLVEVGDARSSAQQAQARQVVADERRLAADMRRDRLADEGTHKPGGAVSLSGRGPTTALAQVEPHHKKKRTSVRPAPTTDFIAYDPSSRKRRKQ